MEVCLFRPLAALAGRLAVLADPEVGMRAAREYIDQPKAKAFAC
jgi:hypothetical protein